VGKGFPGISKKNLPQGRELQPVSSRNREYYNTARPHMTNNDFPPDAPEKLPVTIPFPERNVGNVKSVSWVGGFHHSYYWAA
jgi:hypothetical protein